MEDLLRIEAKRRNPPVISQEEFKVLCGSLSVYEKDIDYAKGIMKRFGAMFNVSDDKELSDVIILDLSWLVNVIASLLTTRHTYCKLGILNHLALRDLWRSPDYPESIHSTLINLLQLFQITYCLTPEKPDFYQRTSLVPSLLTEERPASLAKEWPAFTNDQYCKRIFNFSFVPLGFFSRYMVRILTRRKDKSITPSSIWRDGLFFVTKNKSILIEMKASSTEAFCYALQVSLRGAITSKFFSYVVNSVDSLAKWYNINYTVEIPCVHCYQHRVLDPYLFSLQECETALKEGLSVVYCRGVKPVRLDKLAPDLAMADMADKKIEFSQIEMDTKLGEGSFAIVFKGLLNSQVVAVKQMRGEAQDMGDFRKEIWAMSGLNHANVVRLVGFCTSPLCIISEFIPEGNLFEYIHNLQYPLDFELQLRIAMDIAKALRFLHWRLSPPMIHNDLKTPNVLLVSRDPEADVVAKITDFGLSSQTFQDKRQDGETTNPRWTAPEVLKGQQYSNKIDIYAFGVILWEMAHRDHYMEVSKFQWKIREAIIEGSRPAVDETKCPTPQIKELIVRCWQDDPDMRPDINHCIEVLFGAIATSFPKYLAIATAERPVAQLQPSITSSQSLHDSISQAFTSKIQVSETLSYQTEGSVQCMSYLKSLNQVWIGDGNGNLNSFTANGQFIRSTKAHEKRITQILVVKPNIWTCSLDHTVRISNKTMSLIGNLRLNVCAMVKVLGAIWLGTSEMEVLIVNRRNLSIEKKISLPLAEKNTVGSMLFAPPNVWIGTNNAIIRVSSETENVVDVLGGHTKLVHKMVSVGDEIWSASSDSTICVWDEQSGQCKRVLTGHTGRVYDLSVEKSHRQVVWSCSWDKNIIIWDAKSKRMLAECAPVHSDAVSALVQSAGMVWSGAWDKKICVWQTLGIHDILHSAKNMDYVSFAQYLKTPSCYGGLFDTLPVAPQSTAAMFTSSGELSKWKNTLLMKSESTRLGRVKENQPTDAIHSASPRLIRSIHRTDVTKLNSLERN